jgi:predicted DNA-binding protein (MmcQ/YjbR family)
MVTVCPHGLEFTLSDDGPVTDDEQLAERLRALLLPQPGLTERRMFGGLAFLLDGHMTVCADGRESLMARVDPEEAETLRAEPGVASVEMRGRPMRGWLRVDQEATASEEQLASWVDRSVALVRTLPPKPR